eukprot:TRINITY_DN10277_c0_g1_i1.p1 TRINITY_DN10277_c0_g1~~TRINITY_DN10277_c0_g1_i1.p1  ORF type:complete len:270 (+),score=47.24 TRINITY_DN10277_c0_g1_i1:210-1019(+)
MSQEHQTKDLFSIQSADYAIYRPRYPQALFNYLLSLVPDRKVAWDCATGNGQVAVALAEHFEHVEATDLSQSQLDHAAKHSRVRYSTSTAEKTPEWFEDNGFSLVTVAQALHWFDLGAFWSTVKRVLKPNGIIAVWCYSTLTLVDHPEFDKIFAGEFYDGTLEAYWEPQRKLIDEGYKTLSSFPFDEIITTESALSCMEVEWTLDQLQGYLETWSSVQTYRKKHEGKSPVPDFIERVRPIWNSATSQTNGVGRIRFPLHLRIGRNKKEA